MPTQAITDIDQDYIHGVAHLNDRLLIMLNLLRILSREEQKKLDLLGDLADVKQTLFAGEIVQSTEIDPGIGNAHALRSLITFGLGGEVYALPVSEVDSISKPLPITPLPHAPAHMLGLVNLHGVVLPVIDLRRKFGLALNPIDAKTRFVVLKDHARVQSIILWADTMKDMVRLPESAFQTAPEGVAMIDAKYCQQVARQNNGMIIELNITKIIEDIADGAAEGEQNS